MRDDEGTERSRTQSWMTHNSTIDFKKLWVLAMSAVIPWSMVVSCCECLKGLNVPRLRSDALGV